MARIAGVDIPSDKKIKIALTYLFGIGKTRALKILEIAGVDPVQEGKKDLSAGDFLRHKHLMKNRGGLFTEFHDKQWQLAEAVAVGKD